MKIIKMTVSNFTIPQTGIGTSGLLKLDNRNSLVRMSSVRQRYSQKPKCLIGANFNSYQKVWGTCRAIVYDNRSVGGRDSQ